MTPKEKAQDLIDTYELLFSGNYLKNRQQMKECALICVDEAENSCNWCDYKLKKQDHRTFNLSDRYFQTYWQEVRNEINDK